MKKELNIVGNRKIFFSVSIALILIGILCNIFLGVQLDISFKGGTLLKYSFTGDIDEPKLDAFITDTLKKDVDTTLSTDGDVNLINVSLVEELSLDETTALTTALTKEYPKSELKLINSNSLDPTMGTMFFVKCLVAIALACVFLLIYVALRFRKIGGLSAAVMAIIALLNDILIAYFAFIIFRIPLNDNFVAVVLTILGYSLNGTIVIFDRIRENRQLMDSKTPIDQLVNTSINQSLFRSFNTSLCTFAAIAIVAIMALATGMDAIISFAIPMMFTWIQHKQKKALLAKEAAKAQPKKK